MTAIAWALAAPACVWVMARLGMANGWSVIPAPLLLLYAAVWTARAVRSFRRQKSDKIMTEDNNIIDGGDTHD